LTDLATYSHTALHSNPAMYIRRYIWCI